MRRKRSSVVTRVTVSEFSDQGTKGVSEGLSRREREESVEEGEKHFPVDQLLIGGGVGLWGFAFCVRLISKDSLF